MHHPSLSDADRQVVERFVAAGQGHVFRYLPELDAPRARELVDQARAVDPALVERLFGAEHTTEFGREIEPPGTELIRNRRRSDDFRRLCNSARERGIDDLTRGRVAVVVAAGGQGTRLGSPDPKGMFPVGPVTGKSLFQWHAEKTLYWSRRVGRPIPFVAMVSDATQAATRAYFEDHDFFGLAPSQFRMVRQGNMPAVDEQGRLLLESPSRLALSPNGHGGVYGALRDCGMLEALREEGVRTLSYVQVDNPLIRPVDPVFIGFHLRAESLISSKSVMKRDPQEKVGVFARVGGRSAVVEYTELSFEQARETNTDGTLAYGQGSIAAHCIDVDFAARMADQGLPFHRARKKVRHLDERGATVDPDEPNATKFEMFLFDAIPLAERSLVVETRREAEFSPIKNAEGEDSPATAERDLQALFVRWYRSANLPVPPMPLEISPLEAPDRYEFRRQRGLPPDR